MIPDRSLVIVIDGVFERALAVSTTEIRDAIARAVTIFGASSMGALRAAEVPGMTGIGAIYRMYAQGEIENDDEVAVAFDPRTLATMSEPLVNIRHAASRLAKTGTISVVTASRLVKAASALPFFERTYPAILEAARIGSAPERAQLARMLASIDLKREDAVSALEHVRNLGPARQDARPRRTESPPAPAPPRANGSVHFWEFGPPTPFSDILDFMGLTGTLPHYAEQARLRLRAAVAPAVHPQQIEASQERLFAKAARAWQWATEEEVATTLADLGLDGATLSRHALDRARDSAEARALLRANHPAMIEALRAELYFDDLILKREASRMLSLAALALAGARLGPVDPSEREAALARLCRSLDVRDGAAAFDLLAEWGVGAGAVEAYLSRLACARRIAAPGADGETAISHHPWLATSPKAEGSRRFCTTLDAAHKAVKAIQPVIGVTRVAMITGLGTIGIPNAQAFRPDGEWSSTVGSGKSDSVQGAKIGAVMEEIEKWSQERFAERHSEQVVRTASYDDLDSADAVDPAQLDLPYDSCYRPDRAIDWYRCEDLRSGRAMLAPAAAFTHRRLSNDIYFSPYGARKTVTTNGLAAGMTMAEALTHAICEFVERHARAMDFVVGENPGTHAYAAKPPIDLATVPRPVAGLVDKIARSGRRLIVRDIRGDIAIPVFAATIFLPEGLMAGRLHGDGWARASGWAAHPHPETAIHMAILEASQTVISHIAGAREDLTLNARSLGRHERSDSRRAEAFLAERDGDAAMLDFEDLSGFASADSGADVRWLLDRLGEAGCGHVLAMDYSSAAIAPVRVVRVVVPGLETINAFHTGLRARRALIADLLPRS
jgi:ribosomal protein S12 methylthiotransferase accessory factor